MCVSLCTTVVHNGTEQFDSLPSYPPDNYRSSDDVYWRGGGNAVNKTQTYENENNTR